MLGVKPDNFSASACNILIILCIQKFSPLANNRKPAPLPKKKIFDSHHSNNAKRAVIISLFDRVKSHFGKDDRHGHEKERKYLYALFKKNGYPRSLILFRAFCRIPKASSKSKKERKEGKSEEKKKKEPKDTFSFSEQIN